ncbi:MAG: hypothetical protein PWP23_3151 [Candidatus Sumerlaeota bacterium]|nr:hypothetical protein [Candidatus Sumerlaeota bacterium]
MLGRGHFGGTIAEGPGETIIHVEEFPVLVDEEHGDRRELDQAPETFLALAQGVLCPQTPFGIEKNLANEHRGHGVNKKHRGPHLRDDVPPRTSRQEKLNPQHPDVDDNAEDPEGQGMHPALVLAPEIMQAHSERRRFHDHANADESAVPTQAQAIKSADNSGNARDQRPAEKSGDTENHGAAIVDDSRRERHGSHHADHPHSAKEQAGDHAIA